MWPPLAAGLLAVGVVLIGVTAMTARRPTAALPDLEGFLDRWSELHGDYDPRVNRWVRGWLGLTFRLALPLARRGVRPNVLTIWNAWLALAALVTAMAGGRWPIAAGVLVAVSSVADALDGGVASLTGDDSSGGAVLDSLVDRVAEVLFLVALWVVGAFAWLAVAVGSAIWLLEYARARAAAAGMRDVGVVTVGERPTRIIFCTGALISAGVLPTTADLLASGWLAVLGMLTVVGLVQLLIAARRALG